MQEFANPPSLRNAIFDLLSSVELATDENVKLLDYTIQLFKSNAPSFRLTVLNSAMAFKLGSLNCTKHFFP